MTAPGQIAVVDVHYYGDGARAGCVLAEEWTQATPTDEWTTEIAIVAEYRPGHFFERELPALTRVLACARVPIRVVLIDGYVVLDDSGKLGLGGHLFERLGRHIPVVGLAKRGFAGSAFAARLLRGKSRAPLFVTALGVPLDTAVAWIGSMHGEYRMPTLCTRVDQVCRGVVATRRLDPPDSDTKRDP
jgi:deoxyribonuclease V